MERTTWSARTIADEVRIAAARNGCLWLGAPDRTSSIFRQKFDLEQTKWPGLAAISRTADRSETGPDLERLWPWSGSSISGLVFLALVFALGTSGPPILRGLESSRWPFDWLLRFDRRAHMPRSASYAPDTVFLGNAMTSSPSGLARREAALYRFLKTKGDGSLRQLKKQMNDLTAYPACWSTLAVVQPSNSRYAKGTPADDDHRTLERSNYPPHRHGVLGNRWDDAVG